MSKFHVLATKNLKPEALKRSPLQRTIGHENHQLKLRTALVPLTEPLRTASGVVAASPMRIENGLALVSAEPGSGIEFNDAAVEKYLA
jgi:hypothetical protein